MKCHPVKSAPFLLLPVIWAAATSEARAQYSTQTVVLQAGWNAVHLRIAPVGELSAIFAGTPVETVSAWYPEKQKVASLQDPGAEPWKSTEWRTWQGAGKPGAFLNNLHALESGKGYLIKARAAATVTLSGTVVRDRLRWQAQSLNLTGLPADPEAPATLAGFFANSPAHLPLRVFRLNAGRWQAVPGPTRIDPQAAYWIWCGEGSEYQGPLDVRIGGTLTLGGVEESFTLGLMGAAGTALPVRVTARGTLPLTGLARERLTPPAGMRLGSTEITFTAGAGEARDYRIAWTAGATPATGSATVLELRAAGVRLAVPVNSGPAAATAP